MEKTKLMEIATGKCGAFYYLLDILVEKIREVCFPKCQIHFIVRLLYSSFRSHINNSV